MEREKKTETIQLDEISSTNADKARCSPDVMKWKQDLPQDLAPGLAAIDIAAT